MRPSDNSRELMIDYINLNLKMKLESAAAVPQDTLTYLVTIFVLMRIDKY